MVGEFDLMLVVRVLKVGHASVPFFLDTLLYPPGMHFSFRDQIYRSQKKILYQQERPLEMSEFEHRAMIITSIYKL